MRKFVLELAACTSMLFIAGCSDGAVEDQATPAATEAAAEPVDLSGTMGNIPASDPAELAEFKAATSALYDMKVKAFADGKADPIINRFYAENAISAGPEGKPYEGRDAFMESYSKIVPLYNVEVEPVRTFVSGDAGWEWANFHVTPKDPATGEPFTFLILFLWTKVDGQWVSAGDFYNIGGFPTEANEAE